MGSFFFFLLLLSSSHAETVHLCFAFDGPDYYRGFQAAAASILNSRRPRAAPSSGVDAHFHVITADSNASSAIAAHPTLGPRTSVHLLAPAERASLVEMVSFGFRKMQHKHHFHHPAALYRLLFATVLDPSIDSCIYLDSDVVLHESADISELWRYAKDSAVPRQHETHKRASAEDPSRRDPQQPPRPSSRPPIAAVESCVPSLEERVDMGKLEESGWRFRPDHRHGPGPDPGQTCQFNNGIMVLYLDVWRRTNLATRILGWIRKNGELGLGMVGDQQAYVVEVRDNFIALPEKWNVRDWILMQEAQDEAQQERDASADEHELETTSTATSVLRRKLAQQVGILHYSASEKPWSRPRRQHDGSSPPRGQSMVEILDDIWWQHAESI